VSEITNYIEVSHEITKEGYLSINVIFNRIPPVEQFGQNLIVSQTEAKQALSGLLWQSNDYPDDLREQLVQVLDSWRNPSQGHGKGRTRVLFYFQKSDDPESRKQQVITYMKQRWNGSFYQSDFNSQFQVDDINQ